MFLVKKHLHGGTLINMRNKAILLYLIIGLAVAPAFGKGHVVTLGKPLPVKWFVGPTEDKVQPMKVRGLYVDGKLKEFTTGDPHDVTDQLFVIRRSFRLNDALPAESQKPPQWRWQRGGWLLVDRSTGHITQLKLPEFDPFYSVASWYRDYVAYCGISEDGEKAYAVVTELGRKKPTVRKELGPASQSDIPDSECPAPEWARQPARVTFQPRKGEKMTFTVRGHAADLSTSADQNDKDE